MSKEFLVNVGLPEAKLYFNIIDNDDFDEIVMKTYIGADLIERIGQYYNEDFESLFEGYDLYVRSCYLKKIVYEYNKDGMKFDINIDGDDCASVSLKYTANQLDSINSKKVALIEDILKWDLESEDYDLVKLFKR